MFALTMIYAAGALAILLALIVGYVIGVARRSGEAAARVHRYRVACHEAHRWLSDREGAAVAAWIRACGEDQPRIGIDRLRAALRQVVAQDQELALPPQVEVFFSRNGVELDYRRRTDS